MKTPIWTEEQVRMLRERQNGLFHPYTCCSYNGCKRSEENNWGELIPTEYGWVCPCGKYTQNWSHETGELDK